MHILHTIGSHLSICFVCLIHVSLFALRSLVSYAIAVLIIRTVISSAPGFCFYGTTADVVPFSTIQHLDHIHNTVHKRGVLPKCLAARHGPRAESARVACYPVAVIPQTPGSVPLVCMIIMAIDRRNGAFLAIKSPHCYSIPIHSSKKLPFEGC